MNKDSDQWLLSKLNGHEIQEPIFNELLSRLEGLETETQIVRRNIKNLEYTVLKERTFKKYCVEGQTREWKSQSPLQKKNQLKLYQQAVPICCKYRGGGRTLSNNYFCRSKISRDNYCSHEIMRHLVFGKRLCTYRQNIKGKRHYIDNKVTYDFPVFTWLWNWFISKKIKWCILTILQKIEEQIIQH